MVNYSLHKELPCCYVNKKLLENIEYFVLNEVPKIINFDVNDKYVLLISIEDEFGRLYLNSIGEYKMEKFSEKITSIFFKVNYIEVGGFEMIIRFTSDGTPCIEISTGGHNPKERAIAIYMKINEIVSEYKSYHGIIHHKAGPIIYGAISGAVVTALFGFKKISFSELIIYFLFFVIASLVVFSQLCTIYPKVEFDTNAVIKPKKVVHWIVSILFSLFVIGYLTKKFFG